MHGGELKSITGCHVVAMPYPGRGHINPMINLCTLLASNGITVTVVLTQEWLGLIGSLLDIPNIRLRSIPNVVPSERSRAANYVAFVEAVYSKMETPFDRLLDRLELPASCIIADVYLPWITSVGSRRNIPIVLLWTQAASMFSICYQMHLDHLDENPPENEEEIIDSLQGMSAMQLADLPSATVIKTSVFKRVLVESFSSLTKTKAILFTSFYELQPHVMDYLRGKHPIPLYTVGPSIPYMSLKLPPSKNFPSSQTKCFNWLDSQPKASVLYVSLGSFLSVSEEQMNELSMGLHACGIRFLWIARDKVVSLQEESGEMGLVVPWCDQIRVLCHSSVGGFLTHCGWNSTLESIFAGVPMLTFPLFTDQTHNSKLIVEDWKVGLNLKQIEGTENIVGREEIVKTVKRLMYSNGEEGNELRRRAKELQETCHIAIEKGGSSDNNITAFVKNVVKIKK